jgi:hypothetical protein
MFYSCLSYSTSLLSLNSHLIFTLWLRPPMARPIIPFLFSSAGCLPCQMRYPSSSSSSSSYIETEDLNFLRLTITFLLLHVGRPLWRENESDIRNVITHWLESRTIHNHILLSHLRLRQTGGIGPRIYIPPEQCGPVITPGNEFLFRGLLRLARVRRRYYLHVRLELSRQR